MKLLHLSDLHLNAAFASKDADLKSYLVHSRKSAFEKAVQFVFDHQIAYVVIAGDLLDHGDVRYETENYLVDQIEKLLKAGISVFYTSGNHDISENHYWLERLKKHDNFYAFLQNKPEKITLFDSALGQTIHFIGCGHEKKIEDRNLIEEFPIKTNADIWIGIAHASVVGTFDDPQKMKYLPTTIELLKSRHYDYFALGHIHKRTFLTPEIAYSGSHEPLDITETEGHGGILCVFKNNSVQTQVVDFQINTMHQIAYEITSDIHSLYDFEENLVLYLKENLEPKETDFIRIYVQGRTPLYGEFQSQETLNEIEMQLKVKLGLKFVEINVEKVHVFVDKVQLCQDDTPLTEAIRHIDGKIPEFILTAIPGQSQLEKENWWNDNKSKLEDIILNKMLKVTYEN